MIRPIVQLGAEVLRTPCQPVAADDLGSDELRTLIDDMHETLADAGGVGLAAPQVGVGQRVILAGSFPSGQAPERPTVEVRCFINPRIVEMSEEREPAWEGCLSFLRYRVLVERARKITVEFLNPDGVPARLEAEGFFARVLQHEIDHLDGILTLNRVRSPEDVVDMQALPKQDEPRAE